VAAALAAVAACREAMRGEVYNCRDRDVHVNKDNPKGVDEETVIVCKGHKVRWRERNQEDWSVHFDVSPFVSGVKDIKKGGPEPGAVIRVDQDTSFKYSITVNGKTFDPQIIIMGP
jgi:hypothetical protein